MYYVNMKMGFHCRPRTNIIGNKTINRCTSISYVQKSIPSSRTRVWFFLFSYFCIPPPPFLAYVCYLLSFIWTASRGAWKLNCRWINWKKKPARVYCCLHSWQSVIQVFRNAWNWYCTRVSCFTEFKPMLCPWFVRFAEYFLQPQFIITGILSIFLFSKYKI